MGIDYKYRIPKNFTQYSNKKLRIGFYKSLVVFGEQKNMLNVTLCNHLLGKRDNFSIINPEHHIEMIKRATKFCYEFAKKKQKILYVNDLINAQFDGIIKTFSYKAGQKVVLGRWPSGVLTKNSNLKIAGLLIFDTKRSYFAVKEGTKLGLPILSLNSLNSNLFETMYPIISNNLQGDSLFFNAVLLNHFILEGSFFQVFKNAIKNR